MDGVTPGTVDDVPDKSYTAAPAAKQVCSHRTIIMCTPPYISTPRRWPLMLYNE